MIDKIEVLCTSVVGNNPKCFPCKHVNHSTQKGSLDRIQEVKSHEKPQVSAVCHELPT
jgi:hypothetical protein